MKFSMHLKALLKKNYILWKRNMCCSIFEVFLPFLLVSFFFVFRSMINDDKIPTTSYLSKEYSLPPNYQSIGVNPQTGSPIPPYMKNCLTASASQQPSFRNGHIATIGPNSILGPIENILTSQFQYTIQRYNSVEQMNEYIGSQGYNHDICLGISIDSYQNNVYQYRLFFNASLDSPEVPQTNLPSKIEYLYENIDDFLDPYVNNGFLTLQNWIDNIILQQTTGNSNLQINASISSMMVSEHYNNPLVTYLKGNMGVYIVLPMVLLYLRMTYGLLIEKEKKIREGMKVMGMSDSSFYVSWILYYLIIYILTSILVASALKGSIYESSDWLILFIWHLLFGIALIFQSLFITTFFSRAQIGNIFGMVFFFLQYMLTFILQSNPNPSASTKIGVSILPHVGMVLACDAFLLSESSKLGIQWKGLNTEYANYSIGACMGMTLVNIVIFALLALYFDQVFPNDFGKKRHPLFFMDCLWKKKNQHDTKLPLIDQSHSHINFDDNFEEVSKNLKDQEKQNLVVKIENLSKVYPSGKKAVNGLSFSMYNGQIFALLGHNGAGKTSTIQMLTGMYEMTDGYATALGKDVTTEMQDIRTFMGVCPQYDILFDNLSVKEHLELFASFKGMTDKEEIQADVIKHIEDVDLQEKTNELAKNLSGGQRRRLSVAIAFIGGSKLIYLDEPTSGMDTSARRHIWDMLKRYKNDRIICLTTHFMDEADYLGDRIGIMADGQLVCLGRPLFLKNKFGAGYNLTVVKKNPTDDSQPILNMIKAHINTAIILSDVSSEVVFQLQNEQAPNFPNMFKELDNSFDKLNIQTYGISITTLEEVFLRVAHLKEEKLLNEKQGEKKRNSKIISPIQIDIENQKRVKEDEQLDEIDNFDLNSVRITQKFQIFLYHMKALVVKRLICFKRDIRSLMCEVVLPCLIVLAGLSMTLIKFDSNQDPVLITPINFSPPISTFVGSGPTVSASILTSLENSFRQQSSYSFNSNTNLTPSQWDQEAYNQKTENTSGAWYITNIQNNQINYIAEINTIYRDAPPLYINQMNEAYINYQLSLLGKSSITLQITNSPFPLTQQEKDEAGTIIGIVACFVYAMAFSFIPASLISFSVKERTDKIKHQQLVSGVSLFSYWFSNFFIDFMKHIIPALFSVFMILAYNIDQFNQSTCFSAVSLMMFLYGWSIIPFSYILGFLFEDYGNAQVSVFFLNYLCGGILPLIVFIFKSIKSTQFFGYFAYFFRLIPSFSFGYGLLNVSNRSAIAYQNGETSPSSAYSFTVAGADVLYMSLEGIGYVLLLFFIENASRFTSLNKYFSKESEVKYIPKEYDEDVQKEIDMVDQTKPEDYTVRVNRLRKVFIPAKDRVKVAVDQISFGIGNGECFTLLGVNGAGKTTTFKILSGEIQSTSGDCHIQGFDLKTQLHQARNYIGYCPQFDALCENLTAREHLEMYALIKGIPINMREQLIAKKIKEMDLTEFENRLAGTYSGGNKRKLSVAIAMLGNPPIVFLDEPSTGMDPAARRFMWDVISRISTKRKSSSVILTTHSMEEAEALSTRIAIQVEGQLKCIGTIQQIKDKFGEGYEVEIKLKVPQDYEISNFLTEKSINGQEQNQNIRYTDLSTYLERMNANQLNDKISPKGECSQIYSRLTSTKGISITSLAQFIILENNGQSVQQFIKRNLGEFSIIEHFDDFYRFRIESKITIGSMFEAFEKNKVTLSIDNYSVKQATIEQIFNLFATDQIKVNEQKQKIPPPQKSEDKYKDEKLFQIELKNSSIELNKLQQVFIKNK